MNNFFIPYASKFWCKVTNKRPQRKKIAPKKPLRTALWPLAGRARRPCRVGVVPLPLHRDAKMGRFLTFLIPIGNKECTKSALLQTKVVSPLCARQGDGWQGRWPGVTKGERQNVYLKRFPQPPTHDRKVGARGLWAFLCVVASCRRCCGRASCALWRAVMDGLPGGLVLGASRNHTFCLAKPYVSWCERYGFGGQNHTYGKTRKNALRI